MNTSPLKRSTFFSALWTSWSSGDFGSQKTSARTLWSATALSTESGRRVALAEAGVAGGVLTAFAVPVAAPVALCVPVESEPAASEPASDFALAALVAPAADLAASTALPKPVCAGAPVLTLPAGVAGAGAGVASVLGRRKTM